MAVIDTGDNPRLNLNDRLVIEGAGLQWPLPENTKIICIANATGLDDVGGPLSIQQISGQVNVLESIVPAPARFVADSLSVTLSPDGTGTASIETAGDLEGTTVVWETVDSTGDGEQESILSEGDDAPQNWSPTQVGDTIVTEDGEITILEMYGDDPYITGGVPMRFITPLYNDISEATYVEVVAHPYGGVAKQQGTSELENPRATLNSYKIYMSLNNGPWVQATERIHTSSTTNYQYKTFACRMPNSLNQKSNFGDYGFGEVRAICIPEYGKPVICQQDLDIRETRDPYTDDVLTMTCTTNRTSRGVFFAEYETITDQSEWSGRLETSRNIRLDLSGDTTDYGMDQVAYTSTTWSPGKETLPIVANGKLHHVASYADDFSIGSVFTNCNMETTLEHAATVTKNMLIPTNSEEASAISPRFIFVNCTFGPAYNNSYDPTSDASSLGITKVSEDLRDIIEKGFGVLVKAFFNKKVPSDFLYGFNDNRGSADHYLSCNGCILKYAAIGPDEVIDSWVGQAAYGGDIWGRADLLVGSADYFVSQNAFPWGPINRSEIMNFGGYNYDFVGREFEIPVSSNSNFEILQNARNKIFNQNRDEDNDPQDGSNGYVIYDRDGGPEGDGAYTGWETGFSSTNNAFHEIDGFEGFGIWPSWYAGGAPNQKDDVTALYPDRDEIGNEYDTYPWDWGVGPKAATNPHHDVSQLGFGKTNQTGGGPNDGILDGGINYEGSLIWCKYHSVMMRDSNRQGVYWVAGTMNKHAQLGGWDIVMSGEYQTPIRGWVGSGPNNHWGPGLVNYTLNDSDEVPIPSYKMPGQGQFNPNSFYYLNDSDYHPVSFESPNAGQRDPSVGAIMDEKYANSLQVPDSTTGIAAYEFTGTYTDTNFKIWDPNAGEDGEGKYLPRQTQELRRVIYVDRFETNPVFSKVPQIAGEFVAKFSTPPTLDGIGTTSWEAPLILEDGSFASSQSVYGEIGLDTYGIEGIYIGNRTDSKTRLIIRFASGGALRDIDDVYGIEFDESGDAIEWIIPIEISGVLYNLYYPENSAITSGTKKRWTSENVITDENGNQVLRDDFVRAWHSATENEVILRKGKGR